MGERSLSIPPDHPAFPGHFPGHPVVPGVVLLDEALSAIASAQGIEPGPWHLATVKFESPVAPGEPLVLRWQPTPAGGWQFEIRAAGRRAATGSIQAGNPPDAPA
jgi:3-hydroxymyristoyl/3-hydroxydecanoyl-(acyl carrier protein) dehydratase